MYKLIYSKLELYAFWIILFSIIQMFNVAFYSSPEICLVLTFGQLFLIAILLMAGDLRAALLLHLAFAILSFNPGTIGLKNEVFFTYAKLKVLGPFSFFHVITFIIWLLAIRRYKIRPKGTLLYESFKTMTVLCSLGTIIGLVGITLWSYPIKYFIDPLAYIIPGIIICDTLLLLYRTDYLRVFFYESLYLLIASCISAFFTFFVFNIRAQYSVDETFISNEMYYMFPCVIIGLVFIKNKVIQFWMVLSISLFIINMLGGGRGMTILTTIIAISVIIFILYTHRAEVNKTGKTLFGLFPFMLVAIVSIGLTVSGSELFNRKLDQVFSLFNLFIGDGDFRIRLLEVGSSPFIRIAEFLNLIAEGINNIVGLVLGKGYGGHYTDITGLFMNVHLEYGAFPDEMITTGKFYKAHSAYPCCLLYNGVLGLYLVTKISFKYLRHIVDNFLAFGGFILFIYTFYFDTLFLISGLFLIYGFEYNYKQDKKL